MRAGLGLAVLAVLACAPLAGAATSDVSISGFAFSPATVAVNVGDDVRWTNQDVVTHTASSDDGVTFDTGSILGGGAASAHMGIVGTFGYHCNIHTFMTGKVLVADPSGLADLVVSAIAATDVTPGIAKTVAVTVRNDGTNTAPPSTVHVAYLYHGTLHAIGDADVPQLGPLGDTATVSVAWSTVGKLGDFTLDAEADSGHAVRESDESNNHAQAGTSVLLAGVPGVDLLDPLG